MKKITFDDIEKNIEFKTYVKKGDEVLGVIGFTDHSAAHTLKVGNLASKILLKLGHDERLAELALISGYIHDIGNMISRFDHAQTGAILSFNILTRMGMEPDEIAIVVGAIGNHDEGTGTPVSAVSAAVIIADKTDVRRSRVRNRDFVNFDIHDRVNYAVENSNIDINDKDKIITLSMKIDTSICSVMDYFEIFLSRMLMCKRAAEFLKTEFSLEVNGVKLL